MGERVVPFEYDEKCDICGQQGAFDFYGDLYCQTCVDSLLRKNRQYSHKHRRQRHGAEEI